jgi:hypothetical protein
VLTESPTPTSTTPGSTLHDEEPVKPVLGVHEVSSYHRAAQRRREMSDSEPSQWQIALAVMENIREVQRRADKR